jgi:hypothetical protein
LKGSGIVNGGGREVRTDAVEVALVMAAAAKLLAATAELAAFLATLPLPVIKFQYPPESRAQTVTLQM